MIPRPILRAATSAGIYQPLLDIYRQLGGYDFGSVDGRIQSFKLDPAERRGEVLLPITQGWNRNAYCILAHAFRTRGYEPIIPLCDADLPICTFKGTRYEGDDAAACVKCNHFGNAMLDGFGLDRIPISEILPETYEPPSLTEFSDVHRIDYRGVNVAKYAKASARQFFMRYTLDYDDEYQGNVYRRFLRSGLKLVDAAIELFEARPIDVTLAFHHAYIYGGIYMAVAEAYGVPAVSLSRGVRDQTLVFGYQKNRDASPFFTDHEYVTDELDRPLDGRQRRKIDRLMERRMDGSGARFHRNIDPSKSVTSSTDRTIAGLFTNVLWDASLEAEGDVFGDPFRWVETTIDSVASLDDVELVIKPHPDEAVRGTNESMAEWIEDVIAPLPPNVKLLNPDTDVSPYALMEDLDVTIVYNSTVGLESVYNGIPAVVVGETHYRGLGFTCDPSTSSEYMELLGKLDELEVTEEMRTLARRYAHFLFVRKHIDFPFYESGARGVVKRLPTSHDDIGPGDRVFDMIVERAVCGRPIVMGSNAR